MLKPGPASTNLPSVLVHVGACLSAIASLIVLGCEDGGPALCDDPTFVQATFQGVIEAFDDGAPVAGATVRLEFLNGSATDASDSQGRYSVTGRVELCGPTNARPAFSLSVESPGFLNVELLSENVACCGSVTLTRNITLFRESSLVVRLIHPDAAAVGDVRVGVEILAPEQHAFTERVGVVAFDSPGTIGMLPRPGVFAIRVGAFTSSFPWFATTHHISELTTMDSLEVRPQSGWIMAGQFIEVRAIAPNFTLTGTPTGTISIPLITLDIGEVAHFAAGMYEIEGLDQGGVSTQEVELFAGDTLQVP